MRRLKPFPGALGRGEQYGSVDTLTEASSGIVHDFGQTKMSVSLCALLRMGSAGVCRALETSGFFANGASNAT